jgi:HPt (histidine-containing phosphotransfer) domain-containing protein
MTKRCAVEKYALSPSEQTAHYIKGAAGNLRFKPIEMLASELEKPSGTGSAVDYETIIHRMEAMMERVMGEIRELLRHVDSSAS